MEEGMKQRTELLAAKVRRNILQMLEHRGYGHMGGSLSIADLMAELYENQAKGNPDSLDRDMVVLSKGHAGPALYSTLAEKGYFPREWLFTLNEGGTNLPSHPDRLKTPGVDMTTGSLGQGTSTGTGLAAAQKMKGLDRHVFIIVGDGELNEGQCWEAFQHIAGKKLDNAIVIVDDNKKQLDGFTKDIMDPFSIPDKLRAFGFDTQVVNGQNVEAIHEAVEFAKRNKGVANAIVLDTVKGAGIPYFETLAGNHSVKFDNDEIRTAAKEALAALDKTIQEGEQACSRS